MIANSQYAYAAALRDRLQRHDRWLDLGCGHQFLPAWMTHAPPLVPPHGAVIVGVDRDRDAIRAHPDLKLRIVGDIEHLPFRPSSFDLVTANMVVEHVAKPDALFQEVGRVLAPHGRFLVHTPNLQGYTTVLARCIPPALRPKLAHALLGREERDVDRTYYRSNTARALRELADAGDMKVECLRTVLSSPQLYRVPGAGWIEDRFLRVLGNERWERWRPCIIAEFVKTAG